jgi:uncharacterized protein (TIGR02271 family)
VSKREKRAGEICIRKRVKEEKVQQSVPVMREVFVVEHRTPTGVADSSAGVAEPDEISRVTLYREEIVKQRRLVPTEEVIVRKKVVTEHETVGATLRSEHVETKQLRASSASTAVAGDYDARDVNHDGHVSAGEKLQAATMAEGAHDAHDTNRDGHVSAGEKLKPTLGTITDIVGDEVRMTLHQEQLAVTKREINAGEVDIYKRVQEELVQQSVPLKCEELIVERRPLTGVADANPGVATPDEVMRFTLYREEIVIEKRRVPTEEIIVHKKIITEHETVHDTLRWEEIETEQLTQGDVSASEKIKAAGTPAFAQDSHAGDKLTALGTEAQTTAARG